MVHIIFRWSSGQVADKCLVIDFLSLDFASPFSVAAWYVDLTTGYNYHFKLATLHCQLFVSCRVRELVVGATISAWNRCFTKYR